MSLRPSRNNRSGGSAVGASRTKQGRRTARNVGTERQTRGVERRSLPPTTQAPRMRRRGTRPNVSPRGRQGERGATPNRGGFGFAGLPKPPRTGQAAVAGPTDTARPPCPASYGKHSAGRPWTTIGSGLRSLLVLRSCPRRGPTSPLASFIRKVVSISPFREQTCQRIGHGNGLPAHRKLGHPTSSSLRSS
jgi:hypothetical protein